LFGAFLEEFVELHKHNRLAAVSLPLNSRAAFWQQIVLLLTQYQYFNVKRFDFTAAIVNSEVHILLFRTAD